MPMKPPGDVKFFPEIEVRKGFWRWCVAIARLFAFGVELNTSMPFMTLPVFDDILYMASLFLVDLLTLFCCGFE